jgi:hypothetical protein
MLVSLSKVNIPIFPFNFLVYKNYLVALRRPLNIILFGSDEFSISTFSKLNESPDLVHTKDCDTPSKREEQSAFAERAVGLK